MKTICFFLILVFTLSSCAKTPASPPVFAETGISMLPPTATATFIPAASTFESTSTPSSTPTPWLTPTRSSTPTPSPAPTLIQISAEELELLKTLPPGSVKIPQNLSQFTYQSNSKSLVGSDSSEEAIFLKMIIEFTNEPLVLHSGISAGEGSWDRDEATTTYERTEDAYYVDGRKYMISSDSDRVWVVPDPWDPILSNEDHGVFSFSGYFLNDLHSSEFLGIEKFGEFDVARYRFDEKSFGGDMRIRKAEGEYLILISDHSLISIKAELEGDNLLFPFLYQDKGKITFLEEMLSINEPISILLPEKIQHPVPAHIVVPDNAHLEESRGGLDWKYVFTQDLDFDELVEFYRSELPRSGWSIDRSEILEGSAKFYLSREDKPGELTTAELSIDEQDSLFGSEHALITWIDPPNTYTQQSPTQKNTPEPGSLPEVITDTHGIKMALVPAGEFQMGSEEVYNAKPVHTVYLDAFYIDLYEVTNGLYTACVEAGACVKPDPRRSSTRQTYYVELKYGDYPVINIGWKEARTYCQWRGGDLPTEAQWEKAARGGLEGKIYPWGDQAPTCQAGAVNGAHYQYCDPNDTVNVGLFAANGYGLFDMAGNVSEFVLDWFSRYSHVRIENPMGPPTGEAHLIRGGGWNWDESSLRVADRNYWNSNVLGLGDDFTGFRCVRSP